MIQLSLQTVRRTPRLTAIRVAEDEPVTIPAAPLPELSRLMRAPYAAPFTAEQWADGRQGAVVRVYARGSHALAAGVEAVKATLQSERITLWVPGYFCNEALGPVRDRAAARFYRVLDGLTPDWVDLEERVRRDPGPHILMLVHYFGFPNATRDAREFCDRVGMVLLEDAAHVLVPGLDMGEGELIVFSPRKLLSTPAGGILVASGRWALHLDQDGIGHGRTTETVRWLGRRMAQRIMLSLNVPWHRFWPAPDEVDRPLSENGPQKGQLEGCDALGSRLLTVMAQQLDEVSARRRACYESLLESVAPIAQAKPLFPHLPRSVCPYAFPLVIEGGCARAVTMLRNRGIPASHWPDLPPEVVANIGDHRIAMETSERTMLLPVHQSLTSKQVRIMAQELDSVLSQAE